MHINSHNRFLLLTHFHCNTTQGHLRKFLVQDIDWSCLAHSTWRSWVIIISYMREIVTWGAIIFWRSGNATIHSGKKKGPPIQMTDYVNSKKLMSHVTYRSKLCPQPVRGSSCVIICQAAYGGWDDLRSRLMSPDRFTTKAGLGQAHSETNLIKRCNHLVNTRSQSWYFSLVPKTSQKLGEQRG